MTIETLTLEAGEHREIILCPERDVRDPLIQLECSNMFAVEDVLFDNLPAPAVQVTASPRGTWTAKILNVLVCPERPLKLLVKNSGSGKITLRASLTVENQ